MPPNVTLPTPVEIFRFLMKFKEELEDPANYAIKEGLDDGATVLDADLGLRNFWIEFNDGNGKRHELRARLSFRNLKVMEIYLDRDLDAQQGDWIRLKDARLIAGTGGTDDLPFACIKLTFTNVPIEDGKPRNIVFLCNPVNI